MTDLGLIAHYLFVAVIGRRTMWGGVGESVCSGAEKAAALAD